MAPSHAQPAPSLAVRRRFQWERLFGAVGRKGPGLRHMAPAQLDEPLGEQLGGVDERDTRGDLHQREFCAAEQHVRAVWHFGDDCVQCGLQFGACVRVCVRVCVCVCVCVVSPPRGSIRGNVRIEIQIKSKQAWDMAWL